MDLFPGTDLSQFLDAFYHEDDSVSILQIQSVIINVTQKAKLDD